MNLYLLGRFADRAVVRAFRTAERAAGAGRLLRGVQRRGKRHR